MHENHGLGIYRGIEKIEVEKVAKDYIKIEYGDGGILYILCFFNCAQLVLRFLIRKQLLKFFLPDSIRRKCMAALCSYDGQKIQSFHELAYGDYVVHENHGLGIYRGIEKIEVVVQAHGLCYH